MNLVLEWKWVLKYLNYLLIGCIIRQFQLTRNINVKAISLEIMSDLDRKEQQRCLLWIFIKLNFFLRPQTIFIQTLSEKGQHSLCALYQTSRMKCESRNTDNLTPKQIQRKSTNQGSALQNQNKLSSPTTKNQNKYARSLQKKPC